MQYILAPKRNATCPADWKLQIQCIDGIAMTSQSDNLMFVEATDVAIQQLKDLLGQYLHIEAPIPHYTQDD